MKDVLQYKNNRRDAYRKSKLVELYKVSNDAGLYDIDSFPQDDEDEE